MKTIINSSDLGMLPHWTNLVQIEAGDKKALRTVQEYGDIRFQTHQVGSYLIETQVNRQGAIHAYFKISAKKAEKFMAMPIAQAVAAMEREVA